MKFNRTYSMSVQVSDNFSDRIIVAFPLTVNFKISASIVAPANTGFFQIFNLSQDSRDKIRKDRWEIDVYRQVVFSAGYENQKKLPVAFQGNIVQAYSYRQGTDWITEIEAYDGGFAVQNGRVTITKKDGYDLVGAIKEIASTMPHSSIGKIGDFSQDSSRGRSFSGLSWEEIGKVVEEDSLVFMNKEKIYVLKGDESLKFGDVPVIDSESGLVGSPRRFNNTLDITIIFEPSIELCQEINLQTQQIQFRGQRRVLGISHRGVISGTIGGNAFTTLNLDFSQDIKNRLQAA